MYSIVQVALPELLMLGAKTATMQMVPETLRLQLSITSLCIQSGLCQPAKSDSLLLLKCACHLSIICLQTCICHLEETCRTSAGVIPILSAPSIDGSSDGMLGEAIIIAAKRGLVEPNDHVVCLLSLKDNLVVKIISVDGLGQGMVSSKKGSTHSSAG